MSKTKKKPTSPTGEKVICENRKARHDYHILETLEGGLVLVGSEVKSLRSGRISLAEAYAKVRKGEVWLVNCDIPEYLEANRFNHKPKRDRKILLHQREIQRFACRSLEKGLTLVPLTLYFSNGRVKILLGLCRGKQDYDKRAAKKEADSKRGLRQATMKFAQ